MQARFAKETGVRGKLRVFWQTVVLKEFMPCGCDEKQHALFDYPGSCLNAYGTKYGGCHNAFAFIADLPGAVEVIQASKLFGKVADYAEDQWPMGCKFCAEPVPAVAVLPEVIGDIGIALTRQVDANRLYDTPSGEIEPGCLYYAHWLHDASEPCPHWDNCDGRHLMAMLPNGESWDIDSRARNCTMKADRRHRCWVREGSPEAGDVHVSKAGFTCSAGAGSIAVNGYHGLLQKGEFKP